MNLKRKIAAVVSTGALLLYSFAGTAFASTTLEISGNGSSSDSDITATTTNTTTVVQSNNANITNNVDVSSDTGNNDANGNTGGDVTVKTGDTNTDVNVSNTVNTNSADVNCCPTGDTDVLISGNGTKSDNTVNLDQSKDISVYQNNDAYIKNDVDVDSNTGWNDANDNTGGDVSIKTGDADTTVKLSTSGNVNLAQVGGNGGNGSGSVSARIIGNGSNSDNDIYLDLSNDILLVQSNNADIRNKVDVDSDTGNNDANKNTGGDVSIDTGDIDTHVDIDNSVNFNAADVDCVCLLSDLWAKISGNGSDSDNNIKAKLDESLSVFQDNCGDGQQWEWDGDHKKCRLDNYVDVNSDTGNNDAKDNTGPAGHDPVDVTTGSVDNSANVDNSGNVNEFGQGGSLHLPDFNFDFNLNLNLSDLLDWLLAHA